MTGEINRTDGLTDVVAGVVTADGPKALVFESPDGALRGKPEAYGLPAEATAMALGRLDGDYTMDLAVGAGSDLIVVYGRDRKLSLDEIRQAEVPEARIGQRSFPFAIKSAAIGDFTGDHRTGLSLLSDDGAVYLLSGGKATSEKNNSSDRVENWKSELLARGPWPQATQLVCARVSSIPSDNLAVVDSASHKLHIVAGSADPRLQASGAQLVSLDVEDEPMAVLPMRLNVDALSDLVILRNGQSAPTMAMTQPLATFTVRNTNNSGPGSLSQAIIDANNSAGADLITFSIGSGIQTIALTSFLPAITGPVTIDGTTQPGYAGSPLIELNGSTAGVGTNGLHITAGSSTIKGLVINRFSAAGIRLTNAGGNVLAGNYIGTNANGTAAMGNSGDGVFITDVFTVVSSNTIGGTADDAHNIISGNGRNGIEIDNVSSGNLVQGNFIGTDVTGTVDLGNADRGVLSANAPGNNTIGGSTAGARNVISGNGLGGMKIFGSGTLVQGNYIGTDRNGTAAVGNDFDGVLISSGFNTIGGTAVAARNVISGNGGGITWGGIEIDGGAAMGNQVQGNYIGTDVTGTADLGNADYGVGILNAPNNTVGGTAGARNVISGNRRGIAIGGGSSVTSNQVQGNFIGTDVTGTADLGNDQDGASIAGNGPNNNTIGGTAAGARNVISGNGGGIIIEVSGATGNQVQGNFIGTDVNGIAGVGNSGYGVLLSVAYGSTISGNTIAFNGGTAGIAVTFGTGNAILSNSIHSNAGLGIDLGVNGFTANDACDADTGANNFQNFPVLTSASTTSVQGTLNSTANTTFTIQFFANTSCDPSGNGEGRTFIGSMMVTTNASCNASFTFPAALSLGQVITATATDPSNNTSEFSQCLGGDFSIGFDSSTVTVQAGTKARVTVNINRSGGFTGNVTVTPPAASGGIKPKPPDPITTTDSTVTFKMKIGGGVTPGLYPLTFTGRDDFGRTRNATATLIVQ